MRVAVPFIQQRSSVGYIPLLTALTFLIQSSDTSLLYLSLPAIAHALHVPLRAMDGLVLSYLAAVVLATPCSPWLMARYGERKVYLLALCVFMLAALGCSRAASLPALCLWRLAQGSGGALMMAAARVLLLKTVPEDQQARQLNRVTAIGLLGTLLGPVCGGISLALMPWRGLFLLPLPLCLLCLLSCRSFAIDGAPSEAPFDLGSYLLSAPALLLCLGVITPMGRELLAPVGWLPITVMIGVLTAITLWRLAQRPQGGLFYRALLAHRDYRISLAGNVLVRICLSSTPLLLSMCIQTTTHGTTTTAASLALLCFAGGALSVRLFLNRALERFGYRRLLSHGCLVGAVLLAALSTPGFDQTLMFVLGLSFGLGVISSAIYCCLNTLAFSALNDESYGAGNSLLTLVQLLSMMLGIAISFAFLAYHNVAQPQHVSGGYGVLFRLMACGLALSAALFSRLDKAQGIRRQATARR